MSAWAAPGVKCVCIWADWSEHPGLVRLPMLNEVLTVSTVTSLPDGLFLTFEEIPTIQAEQGLNGSTIVAAGVSYRVDCFRPLITITQEQDMALFHRYLVPTEVDA